MKTKHLLLSSFVLFTFFTCTFAHTQTMVYDIPRVDNITIDGLQNDWHNQGFALTLAADTQGDVDQMDFLADAKLGWTQDGLWLFCHVQDDTLIATKNSPFDNDCLEWFVSKIPASRFMLQYIIPVTHTQNRVDKYDFRISQPTRETDDVKIASRKTMTGYTIEAFLPFENLDLENTAGIELGMQLLFNDADNAGKRIKSRYSWSSYFNTYLNNNALQRIRLIDDLKPGAHIPLNAVVNLIDDEYYDATIIADSSYSGHSLTIQCNNKLLFSGTLNAQNTISTAACRIKADQIANRTDTFCFYVNDDLAYKVTSGEANFIFTEQQPKPARFEYDIRLYELRNAQNPPSQHAVLFLGSSSIRLWSTLTLDFPNHEVIKCGFGGSRTEDVLYYLDRIVTPYPYEQIALFCGINDVNAKIPEDSIVQNIRTFISKIQTILPDCRILLLANNVSVSRKQNYDKVVALNRCYQKLAGEFASIDYVDVFTPLLAENGNIRPELFSADSTHMNPDGYAVWTREIKKILH